MPRVTRVVSAASGFGDLLVKSAATESMTKACVVPPLVEMDLRHERRARAIQAYCDAHGLTGSGSVAFPRNQRVQKTALPAVKRQAAESEPWQLNAAPLLSHLGRSVPRLGVPAGHVRWLPKPCVHPTDHVVRILQLPGLQSWGETTASMRPDKMGDRFPASGGCSSYWSNHSEMACHQLVPTLHEECVHSSSPAAVYLPRICH